MQTFKLEVKYTYQGCYKVQAESLEEAQRIVLRDCGMVGASIETSNDEAISDWEFPMHPSSEII